MEILTKERIAELLSKTGKYSQSQAAQMAIAVMGAKFAGK